MKTGTGRGTSEILEFERGALLRDQIMEVKSGTGISKIEPKRKPVKYSSGTPRRRGSRV